MTTETGPTVGVEEEFLLVRPDGRLARSGPEVVAATDHDGEMQEEITRCQVESATGVCTTGEELLGQLRRLRADLAAEAAPRGLRLLPSGVAVSNHLRPWLPVLLALTANSPYVDGVDTGYSSWRYVRWALWPSAGPPPTFESLAHYDDSVAAMLRLGAIVDRDMVYWDIRLSEKQPTLEIRVSDVVATPEESALLAVIVRGLVSDALRRIDRAEPPPVLPLEILRAFLWRAARDGLAGQCPNPLTGELIPGSAAPGLLADHLRPVLSKDDVDFMLAGLATVRRTGGGAQRQRAAYAKNEQLTDVVDALVSGAVW